VADLILTDGIQIVRADLHRPDHQRAVLDLVDCYARDPMGGGLGISSEVREYLIEGLKKHPTTLVFLAYEGQQPIGLAICFLGFSTFAARPLLNVHDLVVRPEHRGSGIARRLLEYIEEQARRLGCCKLTLEVRADNAAAKHAYRAQGFRGLEPEPGAPMIWFCNKPLDS